MASLPLITTFTLGFIENFAFMYFFPISVFLCSAASLVCRAAQVPCPKEPSPVKSLKAMVLENYPKHYHYDVFLKGDASDLEFAYILGSYLFHHESQLLMTQESDILIDAAKLEIVLVEELNNVKVDNRSPLSSLQRRMGEFVKSILNTEVLKAKLTAVKMNEDGLRPLRLMDLHKMIGECALNQLALVSIDAAILKWVILAAQNEKTKHLIFTRPRCPVVDVFLCNSLISLKFHPEVHLHIEKEMSEFMGHLKGLSRDKFDCYGCTIACLLLPLPESNQHKQELTEFISDCRIMTHAKENPDVPLSDLTITSSKSHANRLGSLREEYEMRTLVGASLQLLAVGIQPEVINVSRFNCFYSGTLINGQFKNEGLQLVQKFRPTILLVFVDRVGEGRNVVVCSLLPLTADVLRVLGVYARDVALSKGDQEILFYAQAAFGISMITAQNFFISNNGCY